MLSRQRPKKSWDFFSVIFRFAEEECSPCFCFILVVFFQQFAFQLFEQGFWKLITHVCCMCSRNSRLQGLWYFFFPLWTLGYRFDVEVCRKSCCSSSSSHWILIFRVWSSLPVAYLFNKILHLRIEFRFLGLGAHYLLRLFTKILGGRIFINCCFWFNE